MSDAYEKMMRELTSAVIADTGFSEAIARKCAKAAMDVLQDRKAANGMLYVSSPPQRLNLLQIEMELRLGSSLREVCRRHATTPRRLKKLFPHGVPTRGKLASW